MNNNVDKGNDLACGIIMPIAAIGSEYPEQHWIDIRSIINRSIEKAGFTPRMVSESDDATIIHKSIIQNIYNDPIIRSLAKVIIENLSGLPVQRLS